MFMATKSLKTRIQLKYDTYANWTTNNPTPLAGELCIVVVPVAAGAVAQEPAILFKVGDGTTPFNTLNFTSGIAADVYDWAKAETKPTYAADEITGLSEYISGEIQDTNTQYKLEQDSDDTHILKLSKKDLNEGDWTVVATITTADTVYDDTALSGRVTALEGLIGSTTVAAQIATAISALDLANTYEAKGAAKAVQGETTATVKSVEDSISTIKDGTSIDSFADVETALAGKQPVGDYATNSEAQGYADAVRDDVDALETKVGTVQEGKTVVQMIEDAQEAATYDDTEVKADIQANTDAIGVLNGEATVEGSVKKTVSDEIAKVIAGAPESFDTLKEVSDWIATHGQNAAQMNSAILALQAILDGIGDTESGEKATVVAYVTDAIAALNIGDYAKAADLTALAGRVTTLEGATHTHANKALLDTYTQTDENLADAVAKKHEHSNKDVLDGITSGKVTEWDNKASADHGHDIADLSQASGYIVFDCGSATVNI